MNTPLRSGPALAKWRPCSQRYIAKNIGGYTLETRRRKRKDRGAQGAEGSLGFLGRGRPFSSRLGGLVERRELPQRGSGHSPGRQCILGIFQGLRSLLEETMHYEVYGTVKCEQLSVNVIYTEIF